MINKTILICLEKLDIGGVETSVYNQSIAFKEKGYNVVVLAKNGIYTEKLQSIGIVCINFEFELKNEIDDYKSSQIIEIIKKYNVEQVHIHQFPCILSAFPACIITGTPYVAFVHSRLTDVFDWYISNYSIYKRLFKFYFENAYKIITINNGAIQLNSKYFNINENKYKILKNSIAFSEYVPNTKINNINNFMIISRIAEEKIVSIQNGINFFINYANTCEHFNGKLAIYGDGTEENIKQIKDYIQEHNTNKYNIFLAGSTNDVAKEMEKYDVVIGMGRCIIEAIATKRLAVVMSPNELKFLADRKNIYNAIEGNFASNDLQSQGVELIISRLRNLTTKQIEDITEENYKIALEELDMLNNVYYIEELENNKNYEKQIFELMSIQLEDVKKQKDEIAEEYLILSKELEQKNNMTNEENKIIEEQRKIIEFQNQKNIELYNELNAVYSSKRFKLANKIANMFTKK